MYYYSGFILIGLKIKNNLNYNLKPKIRVFMNNVSTWFFNLIDIILDFKPVLSRILQSLNLILFFRRSLGLFYSNSVKIIVLNYLGLYIKRLIQAHFFNKFMEFMDKQFKIKQYWKYYLFFSNAFFFTYELYIFFLEDIDSLHICNAIICIFSIIRFFSLIFEKNTNRLYYVKLFFYIIFISLTLPDLFLVISVILKKLFKVISSIWSRLFTDPHSSGGKKKNSGSSSCKTQNANSSPENQGPNNPKQPEDGNQNLSPEESKKKRQKELQKERQKRYREKTKEKRAIYQKEYTKTHKEEIKKRQKEYKTKNKENIQQSSKKYYEDNKKEILEKKHAYDVKHREENAAKGRQNYKNKQIRLGNTVNPYTERKNNKKV